MVLPEFVIPLRLDDLCETQSADQFYVNANDILSLSEIRARLEQAKDSAKEEGSDYIIDHFITFYSLLKKFQQVPSASQQKAFHLLKNTFSLLISHLQYIFDDANVVDSDVQHKERNITKMFVYLVVELIRHFQDRHTDVSNFVLDAKGKKKFKPVEDGWNWYKERHEMFIQLYNFLNLPVKLLWEPPVVEEEFVNLISNMCYKCLEDQGITAASLKYHRETIFQILGLLIKHYLHGLSFCVKIVQLLRMNDYLVQTLAHGVVQLALQCKCPSVVKEIIREIGNTDADQLASDTSGSRSLNLFLVHIAEDVPDLVVPAINILIPHLSGDSVAMRICVLNVLAEILIATLAKEDMDDDLKRTRDNYLDALEEHLHDVNAFVRSKDLQMWQKLHLAKAIPVCRLNNLLEMVVGRLGDKSTHVKKQAVLLIKCLLEGNPYSGQLNMDEIQKQLNKEQAKLGNLNKANNFRDFPMEWEKLLPKIENGLAQSPEKGKLEVTTLEESLQEICKLLMDDDPQKACQLFLRVEKQFTDQGMVAANSTSERVELMKKVYDGYVQTLVPNASVDVMKKKEILDVAVNYLKDAYRFAEIIDRALPIILTLLDSPAISDVLEAINFFTAAHNFGFPRAIEGVRKMLYLIYSKEDNIKNAVSAAYKQLYFDSTLKGRQHHLKALEQLTQLLLQLDISQMEALEEVVKEWVKANVIDKQMIQLCFEKFSLKYPGTTEAQSWSALVLIQMAGSEQPQIIKDNVAVLVNQGLGPRGLKNFILARETCRALRNICKSKSFDDLHRLGQDDDIFRRLQRLIKDGLWRTQDVYFIPFVDEAMNLVYELCDRPDLFSEHLIFELFDKIKKGKRPVYRERVGIVLTSNPDDMLKEEPVKEEIEESEAPDSDELTIEEILHIYTRFVSLLGSVASHYVRFLEGPVLKELKRRNQVDYERKLKRNQELLKNVSNKRNESLNKITEPETTELESNRNAADDQDVIEMRKITENLIVSGTGLLAKFLPLLEGIIKQPKKFNYPPLQNAAVLTLGMFMQVSQKVCDQYLQLLVTVTERTTGGSGAASGDLRCNGLLSMWPLQFRFPNNVEPWLQRLFERMLRDPDDRVRRTASRILTSLIVNDMVKPRCHLSNLACALVDRDISIAQNTRHFFREFAQNNNSLFYTLPSLVSSLTQPSASISEEDFRTIMKFIMGLVTKDKLIECLVEKLCQYFECATTERQWTDLAYCLSLLHYNEKSLRKILENFRCFGNKLYLAEVYEVFCGILATAARNPMKDKLVLDELQALVKEYRSKSCDDHNVPVTLPRKKPQALSRASRGRLPRRKLDLSTDEESEQSERDNENPVAGDTSDDEAFVIKTRSSQVPASARKKRTRVLSPESDSGEEPKKVVKAAGKLSVKKTRNKNRIESGSEDDAAPQRRSVRNSRKRK